uniref:Uncharacterized protein n=1 Tax=Pseudomonas phage KV2023 TaxID=3234047 RepID=A0AB39C6P0_9CAUD
MVVAIYLYNDLCWRPMSDSNRRLLPRQGSTLTAELMGHNGWDGRARTYDLRVNSSLLYQLSYIPMNS